MKELKKSPVTLFLLAVTTLIFLGMQILYFGRASSSQAVFESGGMFGNYVKAYPSQLWRLITPIFVHIGWEHFFFNALALYFVGQMSEQLWGSINFFLLYILSGVMGNVFTLFFTPDVVAAGASTSLFGTFAAIAVLGYFGRNHYLREVGRSYQALILINLLFNLFSPSISLVGHLGGLVGGILCAIFLPTVVDKRLFAPSKRFLSFLVYLALLGGLLIFSLLIK